ncbi:MAG TPA: DUF4097 family beta strand repeat-containing protein [Candidatus Polarisedimenticolaceae bacterium]|nr:DUF4097 family beta strand repeat-containing protein [Candidatus Polarisedimenticolaceae bacterium]
MRATAATLAAGLLLAVAAHADEARQISLGPGAVVETGGFDRVEVRGLSGTVSARVGAAGELRYECRALDNRRTERSLELWAEGRTLRLTPPREPAPERRLVELTLPPELAFRFEGNDSSVQLGGLHGTAEIRGARLQVLARAIGGDLQFDVEAARVNVEGANGQIGLETRQSQSLLSRVQGAITVQVIGGSLEMNDVAGVEGEVEDGTFKARTVSGPVELEANRAKVDIGGLQRGAVLRLNETPLVLSGSRGTFQIDTDAEVQAQDLQGGSVTINSYGANVRAAGINAPLELTSGDAEVRLERLGAAARVSGDRLTLYVGGVKGKLDVQAHGSSVVVEDAGGGAEINNDFGDVVVRRASQRVRITSTEGDVRVTEHAAPLQIAAAGTQVEVGYSAISGNEDSSVVNEQGAVNLRLPPKAACQVRAESRSGSVRSELPGVTVNDDGSHASGVLLRAAKPVISVVSEGDVTLAGGGGPAAPAGTPTSTPR